jgi:molybdopterin-guanine dinucleotide biosynthesis protein A
VLNANGDPGRFAGFGLPVAADSVPASPVRWRACSPAWSGRSRTRRTPAGRQHRDRHAVLSARTSWRRLREAAERDRADIACAASLGRTHPVFALWPVRLAGDLRRALVDEGTRKIDAWTARYRVAEVPFPAEPLDPFFNLNTPDDVAEAERLLAAGAADA